MCGNRRQAQFIYFHAQSLSKLIFEKSLKHAFEAYDLSDEIFYNQGKNVSFNCEEKLIDASGKEDDLHHSDDIGKFNVSRNPTCVLPKKCSFPHLQSYTCTRACRDKSFAEFTLSNKTSPPPHPFPLAHSFLLLLLVMEEEEKCCRVMKWIKSDIWCFMLLTLQ